jgi:nicotinate-nucleotide pyrophosphorylase (carboxylating)
MLVDATVAREGARRSTGGPAPIHFPRPLRHRALMDTLPPDLEASVARALAEDVGAGDLTALLVPEGARCRARVITREAAVLCGTAWVEAVFRQLDPAVRLRWHAADGDAVAPDALLFEAEGPARPLLTGERTALNFLQTLSGTATQARRYVEAIAGTDCAILDTRKTLPGLRLAQKYAVRCGGGRNHRIGLYDGILVKENHIAAAGGIGPAVRVARELAPAVPVEVEVETLDELEEAFAADADMALLDEFTIAQLREAVRRNRARERPLRLEASGGVDLRNVREVAETGVDYVSIGAITKHVKAVDLSMRMELTSPR